MLLEEEGVENHQVKTLEIVLNFEVFDLVPGMKTHQNLNYLIGPIEVSNVGCFGISVVGRRPSTLCSGIGSGAEYDIVELPTTFSSISN